MIRAQINGKTHNLSMFLSFLVRGGKTCYKVFVIDVFFPPFFLPNIAFGKNDYRHHFIFVFLFDGLFVIK